MEDGTQRQPGAEQERPSSAATSGEGGAYKPSAKGRRAERESEGFIVPRKPMTRTSAEGRDPALVMLADGGKCEGMVARPNNPKDKVREPQSKLCTAAEHRRRSGEIARPGWILRGDVQENASWSRGLGGVHAA
jgi:hypothetical protein